MMLPVAILAGGLATRLRPLTDSIPKSLVPVNGEPFIAWQLRLLKKSGFTQVVLCVGHLGQMVQDFVGSGSQFGLDVTYSYDGPRLQGTGGAIRNALPLLGGRFFVLYGDSYLLCDYSSVQEAFERSGKLALMTVYRNQNCWDTSNVEFAGGRILAYDKINRTDRMAHIDYGLGVFDARAFEEPGADLACVYQSLLRKDQLAAWEIHERFYEIGSLQGIEDLSAYLREQ
jgi:Nucleoside-diphosphate-sugar pyrophosphorylase involved in lipopolysaccharide biosynthesis/translation initiation factor 2B, gamma/epsilon subunits (eIF-2Bgamma/eIF-2Bepsilon)